MLTKLKEERDKKRLSVNLLHTDPSSPRTNLPFSEVAALIVKDDSCPNNQQAVMTISLKIGLYVKGCSSFNHHILGQ
jgi:hypothetical protein